MNKLTVKEFRENCVKASTSAIDFGAEYISNVISDNITYDIEFNTSYDNDEVNFEVFRRDDGRIEVDLYLDQVVRILYRNGKVPVWIDISIIKSGKANTRLNLLCAGRYTDRIDELYYVSQGTYPFGVKSPRLLPWVQEGNRYYLFYRRYRIHRFIDDLRWRYNQLRTKGE